ncbi:dethiobiotin synthase [Selenomonas sp.]|jgi:dethiobiotin synthetase|uniref:dethiobiotin synthase n=1 Tax=Selenomonas sp. TaxID=2053611 RepID=UPI003A0FDA11
MGKCLFITGTGTDIGKTYVTGLLVKCLHDAGYKAGYYKAALSGAERGAKGELLPGDALHVNETAQLGETIPHLVSYIYEEAVSPHLAALRSHQPIDFQKVRRDFEAARGRYDYLTMEGSGGIICPLRWDAEQHVVLDDLVKDLGLGTLVVADAGLGTINAVVLTVEHLHAREIPVRGIVFNHSHPGDFMEEDNAKMVEEMSGVPVVAYVRDGDRSLRLDAAKLAALYD